MKVDELINRIGDKDFDLRVIEFIQKRGGIKHQAEFNSDRRVIITCINRYVNRHVDGCELCINGVVENERTTSDGSGLSYIISHDVKCDDFLFVFRDYIREYELNKLLG